MRRVLLVVGLCAFAAGARAQVGEFGVSVGKASYRNNDVGTDGQFRYTVGGNFRLGLRLTLNTYRFFGHEIGYGYNRGNLEVAGEKSGMSIHQFGYSFLAYATPEGSAIRPFAAGGGHFSTFYPPGTSVYTGGYTKFGFNYGGGLKVRITPVWALRFDVRDYATAKPFPLTDRSGMLHQLETSAGLSFIF
ncbi:MAG: porin family protein [Bryobacterales bacterium]|nr:porin family protein [Bryobacterales bacterium]